VSRRCCRVNFDQRKKNKEEEKKEQRKGIDGKRRSFVASQRLGLKIDHHTWLL
jgi:hypothetical protein